MTRVRQHLTPYQLRSWIRLKSPGPAAGIFPAGLSTKARAIGWAPIHALTLSATLLWLTGYFFPREFEIPVELASLVPNGGHAFAVRLVLPNLPPYLVFRTDGVGSETASALELAEDGRALGPPHALHSEIRKKGEGRFSHWNDDLYFSTSDNSDPEVNGRVYTAKIPTAPPVWLGWTAVGMIVLSLSLSLVVRGPLLARSWIRLKLLGPAARIFLARLSTKTKAVGWVLIHALTLSAMLLWLTGYLFPRQFEMPVEAASLVPNGGHAFVARLVLPTLPPYLVFRTDGVGSETASALELAEDGRALGPPHALHSEIREKGEGRFSHWNDVLYFSTSDNSDPAVNGRVYTAKIPTAPPVWLGWTAVGMIVLSLSLSPVVRRPLPFGPVTALTIAGAIAATCFIVLWVWLTGASASLSVAGVYPVSDAFGYVTCSNLLLDRGARSLFGTVMPFEVDIGNIKDAHIDLSAWCQDRPFFYSGFLASVFALAGRALPTAMMFQAAVVGFALGLFAREVGWLAGLGGALVAGTIFLLFAHEHALPMLTTETLGLTCGTVAVVLLLQGAAKNSAFALLLGVGLLAFALQARPGALCALPMILLWVAIVSWRRRRPLLSSLCPFILVLGAVSLLQPLVLWANDGSFMHLYGSFSYVLYGLSVGGGGWGRMIVDRPELFPGTGDPHPFLTYEIFRLAIQNILAEPQLFIRTVVSNLSAYWTRQFDFISSTTDYRLPFRVLWTVGGVSAIVNWRDPVRLLIGLLSLGEVLSGPIIIEEGGSRLLAATLPVQAVQAALGFGWVCSGIRRIINADAAHIVRNDMLGMGGQPLLPALCGMLIIVATLLPYSSALGVAARRPIAAIACMNGASPVVVRLGLESNVLSIMPNDTSTSHPPREIRADDLRKGLGQKPTWFSSAFAALVPGERVIQGFQSTRNEFGMVKPILWRGELPKAPGTVAQFCVEKNADVTLAGMRYYRARSVDLLSDFEPQVDDILTWLANPLSNGLFSPAAQTVSVSADVGLVESLLMTDADACLACL